MTAKAWLFLAKVVAITCLLGLAWFLGVRWQYPQGLRLVGDWLFPLIGVRKWELSWTLDHMANIIPFIALVLATPAWYRPWRRGLAVLLGGLAILVVGHLLMLIAFYFIIASYGFSEYAYRWAVPVWVVNDSLPLVLWLACYHRALGQLFPRLRFGSEAQG